MMTTDLFANTVAYHELTMDPQYPVQVASLDLPNMVHSGCNSLHKQATDIHMKVGTENRSQTILDLDKAARQLYANLQQLATQVGHQGQGFHLEETDIKQNPGL